MNVSIGPTSIVGFIAAALAALVPILGELADAAEPLGVSPEFWMTVSAVLAVLIIIFRYLQAIVGIWRAGPAPQVVPAGNGAEAPLGNRTFAEDAATDVEVHGLPSDPHEGGVESVGE